MIERSLQIWIAIGISLAFIRLAFLLKRAESHISIVENSDRNASIHHYLAGGFNVTIGASKKSLPLYDNGKRLIKTKQILEVELKDKRKSRLDSLGFGNAEWRKINRESNKPPSNTSVINKFALARRQKLLAAEAVLNRHYYSKKEFQSLIYDLSTTFKVWKHSTSHTWCHNNHGKNDGILYVKLPKCASSTASGVAMRVADKLGHRILGQKCAGRYLHSPASHKLRNYGQRNKSSSFLWSIIREPNDRTVSHYFFEQVSRLKVNASAEAFLSFLNENSNMKKSYMLRYLKLQSIEDGMIFLIKEIMENYDFIGIADRMYESLVTLAFIMQVPTVDMVLISSKVSGGYDAGRTQSGCVKLVKRQNYPQVEELLNSKVWRKDNWDYLLYQVVNRTLDNTIDLIGRSKVELEVAKLKNLTQLVTNQCLNEAVFPCPETLPYHRQVSEMSCYYGDSGCGYKCIDRVLFEDSNKQWEYIQNKLGVRYSRILSLGDKNASALPHETATTFRLHQNENLNATSNRVPEYENFNSSSRLLHPNVNSKSSAIPVLQGELNNATKNVSYHDVDLINVSLQNESRSVHFTATLPPKAKVDSASNRHMSILPNFLLKYISFHRESIKDGKVKDGVPYLVYKCYGGCAGLGGRIKAMIKAFYVSVCAERVFIIDSPYPFPLENYLAPNQISWNAAYDSNVEDQDIFMRQGAARNNIVLPQNVTGIRILKAHGKGVLDLQHIWLTPLCRGRSKLGNFRPSSRIDEHTQYHWASKILFRFTAPVKSRALEIMKDAGLSTTSPFVSAHIRTGSGPTWNDNARRLIMQSRASLAPFASCFQLLRQHYNFSEGYIASDNSDPKERLNRLEPLLKMARIESFHIDRSLSPNATLSMNFFQDKEGSTKYGSATIEMAKAGTLDLFAELKILTESRCIIMSKSSLSFAAHVMALQPHCGLLVEDCSNKTVLQPFLRYNLRISKWIIST